MVTGVNIDSCKAHNAGKRKSKAGAGICISTHVPTHLHLFNRCPPHLSRRGRISDNRLSCKDLGNVSELIGPAARIGGTGWTRRNVVGKCDLSPSRSVVNTIPRDPLTDDNSISLTSRCICPCVSRLAGRDSVVDSAHGSREVEMSYHGSATNMAWHIRQIPA